jgi:hypothetical protein
VAVQSLKDLGPLTYRMFLELFRHMVGLLGRVISPSQGLYLHRKTQHRKTRTNIHALSGIRTHDPRNQPAKTHASDRMATVTDYVSFIRLRLYFVCQLTGCRTNRLFYSGEFKFLYVGLRFETQLLYYHTTLHYTT